MPEDVQQQIAEEYYKLLDKPVVAKQRPQFALCVIGLVGAGKSTVLKKLCEKVPVVRVSGDEVRKLISEKGLAAVDSMTLAHINARVIDRLTQQGYSVAYDNDFGNPTIRAGMEEFNRQRDIPIIWIRVAPPEGFILNKLRNHEPTYLFKDADEAVATYYARKVLHQQEEAALSALPYLYTFDTSRPDLDEQVAEAAAEMKLQLASLEHKTTAKR